MLIVPTLLRGNASWDAPRPGDAERHGLHSHAERGNDQGVRAQPWGIVAPIRGEFRSDLLAISIPFWPFLPFSQTPRPARLCSTESACGEQENADDLLGRSPPAPRPL
ncbi:hypothetical protein FQ192_15710 [Pseudomonas sp. ANT_J12]|nr:hypothetical protein FQ192_15710 [Pseudomonas sp. ANT_J12]